MTDTQGGFPTINQPFVDDQRYITKSWRQLLVNMWRMLGGGSGGGIDGSTILVNPGTGNNKRYLNVALSDYANVNDYLNDTDTNYNGAIARALADKNKAYFPAKPYITDPNNYYRITTPIVLSTGQSILGDGAGVTKIVSETPNQPVIKIGSEIWWFHVKGVTIAHVGSVAVAGGDGIQQGQGLLDWVDNCTVEDVLSTANYHGMNMGKAFKGTYLNVLCSGNIRNGFNLVTTGNATVPSGSTGGPLQQVLINCAAMQNGYDGFAYTVTGTAYGGAGVGSSVGQLESCVTFNNAHHGMSFIGTAAQPLQSIRVVGGFVGEDLGQGIYMDTYGVNHIVSPDYMELAGFSNIYLTANNSQTSIQLQHCNGAMNDGVTSIGATDTMIMGGSFRGNGRYGSGGIGLTWAGIRIDGGTAQINNIRAFDTGGYQNYGISVTGDNVIITGCRLTNNATLPIVWATGPTNSQVIGNLPSSVNVLSAGDLQVNSLGIGVAPSGITGQIRATGAAAFNNGVTITNSGLTLTTGVPGNGITVDNVTINSSLGVGTPATGVSGRISTSTLYSSVDIVANGQFHANGASAFAGGVTVSAGGMNFTTGVAGNGLTVDNITANTSIGVGTPATAIAGRLTVSGLTATNTLSVASTSTFSGAMTAAAIGTTTLTSSVDVIANGQFHANGPAAFAGGTTVSAGGMTFTTGVSGNGLTVDNVRVNFSLGVGTAPIGTAGRVDITSGIYLNGTAYTNP